MWLFVMFVWGEMHYHCASNLFERKTRFSVTFYVCICIYIVSIVLLVLIRGFDCFSGFNFGHPVVGSVCMCTSCAIRLCICISACKARNMIRVYIHTHTHTEKHDCANACLLLIFSLYKHKKS